MISYILCLCSQWSRFEKFRTQFIAVLPEANKKQCFVYKIIRLNIFIVNHYSYCPRQYTGDSVMVACDQQYTHPFKIQFSLQKVLVESKQ